MEVVAIRVDASLEIGSGHVMRCLTLAEALRKRGKHLVFICREHPGNLLDLVRERGFEVIPLPAGKNEFGRDEGGEENTPPHSAWLGCDWQTDADQTRAVLAQRDPDWLIVDHYALDSRWETALRANYRKLMVIDDLADRRHECDLILDQNLQIPGRYAGLLAKNCRTLLGPRYALLRQQFANARRTNRARNGTVSQLLVFFGGVDSSGETQKALTAIGMLDRPDLMVDVVIGPTNPNRLGIEATCRSYSNMTPYFQVEDMAARMAEADLFVGSGGSSSWERCCLGLPSLVLSTADNQIAQCEALARFGAQVYLGVARSVTSERLLQVIGGVLHLPELLNHLSERSQQLVDAMGAERVCNHMDTGRLYLRRAEQGDCVPVFGWRNHPDTRRFSSHSRLIDAQAHEEWFSSVLADPNRELLIAEHEGQPIGVLRYDIAGGCASVSVYLVPGLAGQGWGRRVLLAGEEWLRNNRRDVLKIEGEVRADNLASKAVFQAACYHLDRLLYRKVLN